MGLDKWTAFQALQMGGSFHSVAYGRSIGTGIDEFVAVGPGYKVRSFDGSSWVQDPQNATEPVLEGIAYGGGVFVAVGPYGIYKWDGQNWSAKKVRETLRAVAYGTLPTGPYHRPSPRGDLFVAVGDAGAILTSPDGVTWTRIYKTIADDERTTQRVTSEDLRAIAFGNQHFVVAAGSAAALAPATVVTSSDGVSWSIVALPALTLSAASNLLRTLTFGSTSFVGVTEGKKALTSSNGSSWTDLVSTGLSAEAVASIVYGFDRFIVVGAKGSIRYSAKGVVWTDPFSGSTSPSSQHLGGVAYGKHRFVAVGGDGGILMSGEYPVFDLKTWWRNFGRYVRRLFA